jgi:hypothetical protein
MKSLSVPQTTVLEDILEWSTDRPLWQRDALRRIVSGRPLNDIDQSELLELCKEGRRKSQTAVKAVPLKVVNLPANPDNLASVCDTARFRVLGAINRSNGVCDGIHNVVC